MNFFAKFDKVLRFFRKTGKNLCVSDQQSNDNEVSTQVASSLKGSSLFFWPPNQPGKRRRALSERPGAGGYIARPGVSVCRPTSSSPPVLGSAGVLEQSELYQKTMSALGL